MARVTVEDCLQHVDNRFELVMLAAKRAREIAVKGAEPLVGMQNDKPTVVALREVAAGLVSEQSEAEAVMSSLETAMSSDGQDNGTNG